MRLTPLTVLTRTTARIADRYTAYERASDDVSTGRRLHRVSDDPAAMHRVMALTAAHGTRQRELSAAADAATWLDTTDSTLQSAVDRLQRARQLVISGAGTRGASERGAIAAELRSITEQVLAIANARHHGRPLLGGTADGAAVSAAGGVYSYTGDAGAVVRRVGPDETVQANVTAQDTFWFTAPAGYPDNAFALLDHLAAAIEAGDTDRAAAGLDAVDAALDQATGQLARVGARANQVEAARTRTADLSRSLLTERSELQDVDIAEAVLRLRTEQTAYETALAAIGRSFPPNLAAFLR